MEYVAGNEIESNEFKRISFNIPFILIIPLLWKRVAKLPLAVNDTDLWKFFTVDIQLGRWPDDGRRRNSKWNIYVMVQVAQAI